MLTTEQENFLQTLPDDPIKVNPWDPNTHKIAGGLIAQIKNAFPELEILYTGASALKIAGKNDIDISVLDEIENFDKHLPKFIEILGPPLKIGRRNIRWEFNKDGYDIDIYLTDKNSPQIKEQKKTFELLRDNPSILEGYRKLKENAHGLKRHEYQKRKYEFYNRILGID
jgi:GrpB-like predicted nucleotidyltransferase (UPF0157 family)